MIKNTAAENTREKLISTLEQDSQAVIDWFKINEMIVNPDKFQAIFVKKNCRMKDSYVLNINNQTINSEIEQESKQTIHYLLNKKIIIFTKKQAIKCDRKNAEVHGLYGKRSALRQFRLI